eukprot:Platyproteum_vivax@DN5989_c0_g1_i2.p1
MSNGLTQWSNCSLGFMGSAPNFLSLDHIGTEGEMASSDLVIVVDSDDTCADTLPDSPPDDTQFIDDDLKEMEGHDDKSIDLDMGESQIPNLVTTCTNLTQKGTVPCDLTVVLNEDVTASECSSSISTTQFTNEEAVGGLSTQEQGDHDVTNRVCDFELGPALDVLFPALEETSNNCDATTTPNFGGKKTGGAATSSLDLKEVGKGLELSATDCIPIINRLVGCEVPFSQKRESEMGSIWSQLESGSNEELPSCSDLLASLQCSQKESVPPQQPPVSPLRTDTPCKQNSEDAKMEDFVLKTPEPVTKDAFASPWQKDSDWLKKKPPEVKVASLKRRHTTCPPKVQTNLRKLKAAKSDSYYGTVIRTDGKHCVSRKRTDRMPPLVFE